MTTNLERAIARADLGVEILQILTEVIDEHDLDDLRYFRLGWVYNEPSEMSTEDPAVRRAAALEWLRRHLKGVQAVAHRYGSTVDKDYDEIWQEYGVITQVPIPGFDYSSVAVSAFVSAALTCEMVPTGDVETIPAQPERTVPKLERVCPPSIFADIGGEVLL